MYSKIYGNSSFGGIRGTHYSPDQAHVYYVSNNGNSGSAVGQILRIRVTPIEQIYNDTTLITSAPETRLNLDAGQWDIRWTTNISSPYTSGQYATSPKLARNGTSVALYKYPSAPSGGLAGIDPDSLSMLVYSSAAILENGQGDNYYAVRLASGNYGVFRVYKDTVDPTKTRFDWISYKLNAIPDNIGFGYYDPRDILIKEGPGGNIAYVTAKDEFGNDRVLAVPDSTTPVPGSATAPLPNYTIFGTSSSYAIDDPDQPQPLSDAQQLALYNGNVYVVDAAGLWSIDEITYAQTLVASVPIGAVGLLIDDAGTAIITNTQGSLFKVDLTQAIPSATPLPFPLAGPSGFLTWSNASKTAFCVTVRDPVNKVCTVDLTNGEITVLLDLNTLAPPLADPWSVEVLSPSLLFLASDAELGSITLAIVSNALVLGIGLVPFDYINQDPASPHRGKADTTPATGYFYQVNNVPFGGNLNLMVNHAKGYAAGLRYYRVKFKNLGTGALAMSSTPSPISCGGRWACSRASTPLPSRRPARSLRPARPRMRSPSASRTISGTTRTSASFCKRSSRTMASIRSRSSSSTRPATSSHPRRSRTWCSSTTIPATPRCAWPASGIRPRGRIRPWTAVVSCTPARMTVLRSTSRPGRFRGMVSTASRFRAAAARCPPSRNSALWTPLPFSGPRVRRALGAARPLRSVT